MEKTIEYPYMSPKELAPLQKQANAQRAKAVNALVSANFQWKGVQFDEWEELVQKANIKLSDIVTYPLLEREGRSII